MHNDINKYNINPYINPPSYPHQLIPWYNNINEPIINLIHSIKNEWLAWSSVEVYEYICSIRNIGYK